MSTAKQRIIVLAGLVVLLIAAPILNYAFNTSQNKDAASKTPKPTTASAVQTDGSVTTGNFFSSYVSDRDSSRTEEVKYLDSIVNDKNTDAATKKTAQQQKADIALSMEKELSMESLLKAKGFSQVAVIYHAGSVNVIVGGKAQLTDAQVAQILDIAVRETGEKAENVKVIPVN